MIQAPKIPAKWLDVAGCKRHTIGQIMDGDTVLIISKRWMKSKQRWCYETETLHHVLHQRMLVKRAAQEDMEMS